MKTAIKIEDSEKVIEFTHMIVDGGYITLQGMVNAKVDMELDENAFAFFPVSNTFSTPSINDTYFAGVPKDIEITFDPDRTITNEVPFVRLELFGQSYNLNLETGEEVKGATLSLMQLVGRKMTDFNYYETAFNDNEDELYKDASGKIYGNVVAVSSSYENPKWYYHLNQKYASLKVDVGLDALTASEGYGSSKVTFMSDGNILKTLSLAPGQATTTVELNISNVNNLEIQVEQIEGNDGYQRILLGNSAIMAK